MLVAFWSTHHGQACTTTNAAAVACAATMLQQGKLLMAHTQARRSTLETCLLDEKSIRERETGDFANHGMDALLRLVRNERLRDVMVPDYTWSLLHNHRFDLLPGTAKMSLPQDDAGTSVCEVFHAACRFYDNVLVDVHSGIEAEGTTSILQEAECCLVCVNQNRVLLDTVFSSSTVRRLIEEKKAGFLVSRYDRDAGISLRDIARRYSIPTDRVHPVPYNAGLMNACNRGRLLEFVLRHLEDPRSPEQPLMKALRTIAALVLEREVVRT